MKKRVSFIIVCVIAALLLGTPAAQAAGAEEANAMLFELWPEAAGTLRPVNLSMEKIGIRLDVISAVLNDEHYLVTYSLTDMNGDRINENTDCSPTLEIPASERIGWNKLLSYDPEEHRAVYGAYFDYKPLPGSPELMDTDNIRFTVNGLENPVRISADLWRLMDGRNYTAEAVPVPAEPFGLETYIPEEEAVIPDVLNPENNLHIPVTDGIELSGIGWIDGNMHIQIHISDYIFPVDKGTALSEFARYTCMITLHDTDGYEIMQDPDFFSRRIRNHPGFVREIEWRDGNDKWIETIFPVRPEETALYTIDAEFTCLREGVEDLLLTEWSVSFPVNMILEEDS